MGDVKNQKKVFDFLTEHLDSQQAFTTKELEQVTSWRGKTFRTYWSKQFAQFVVGAPNNKLRVSESFRPFTDWDRFREHVTQVRRVAADYHPVIYEKVVIFEFFMPLTNEAHLKTTLDALFYKDTIVAKLKAQEDRELPKHFKQLTAEKWADYIDRLCGWIAQRFAGYSISHVNGRFRAEKLCTREQAASPHSHKRYLIDETTAVTRFIFPCEDEAEAEQIRWFFKILFVESIIQLVNGEDEIWMVESGLENRVYVWRIDRSEPD